MTKALARDFQMVSPSVNSKSQTPGGPVTVLQPSASQHTSPLTRMETQATFCSQGSYLGAALALFSVRAS